MKNTFCTIITPDYYPYAQAIIESLDKCGSEPVRLEVFVSARVNDKSIFHLIENDKLKFTFIEELNDPVAEQLNEKYQASCMDKYRWSMKPVFINYLLEYKCYHKVIFLDPDLFFFNDPQFLFDLLDEFRVILTPHWRCADDPKKDLANFRLNFKEGIYNAGFIGVRNDGIEIMKFWVNLCLVNFEKNYQEGFYDDQKYLDILHSRFEGIGIVRHRGCNVANWNRIDCRRLVDENGEVLINGLYPIIFIHFTPSMMRGVLSGMDKQLSNHFLIYAEMLKKFNPDLDLILKTQSQLDEKSKAKKSSKKNQYPRIKEQKMRLKLMTRIRNSLGFIKH